MNEKKYYRIDKLYVEISKLYIDILNENRGHLISEDDIIKILKRTES